MLAPAIPGRKKAVYEVGGGHAVYFPSHKLLPLSSNRQPQPHNLDLVQKDSSKRVIGCVVNSLF